jgi:hypothetical protein
MKTNKKAQLAAVLFIVLLVAAIAGILLFSQKRAGMAVSGVSSPASYVPTVCQDTTVTINDIRCRTPQWLAGFQSELTKKCGTYSTGQPGPAGAPRPNCRATLQSTTATGCVYNIDCR